MRAGPSRKKRTKTPVEELALKYLNTPKPLARARIERRMARNFGWKATKLAINQMVNTLTICDPNFVRP